MEMSSEMWKDISGLMKYGDTVTTKPLKSIQESLARIFHRLIQIKSKGHQAE